VTVTVCIVAVALIVAILAITYMPPARTPV
jgi:hypothetical protein